VLAAVAASVPVARIVEAACGAVLAAGETLPAVGTGGATFAVFEGFNDPRGSAPPVSALRLPEVRSFPTVLGRGALSPTVVSPAPLPPESSRWGVGARRPGWVEPRPDALPDAAGPLEPSALDELELDELESGPVAEAMPQPMGVPRPTPTPSATASAPTRPIAFSNRSSRAADSCRRNPLDDFMM
jgi:hypothetical protein